MTSGMTGERPGGFPRRSPTDGLVRPHTATTGRVLGGATSVETREILMSGANPLLDRTPAMENPTAVSARGLRLTPLQQVVGLALGAPEFQRR